MKTWMQAGEGVTPPSSGSYLAEARSGDVTWPGMMVLWAREVRRTKTANAIDQIGGFELAGS